MKQLKYINGKRPWNMENIQGVFYTIARDYGISTDCCAYLHYEVLSDLMKSLSSTIYYSSETNPGRLMVHTATGRVIFDAHKYESMIVVTDNYEFIVTDKIDEFKSDIKDLLGSPKVNE